MLLGKHLLCEKPPSPLRGGRERRIPEAPAPRHGQEAWLWSPLCSSGVSLPPAPACFLTLIKGRLFGRLLEEVKEIPSPLIESESVKAGAGALIDPRPVIGNAFQMGPHPARRAGPK